MNAQQEFFMAVKERLIDQGYAVYDSALPPDGTPYPFIYLVETSEVQLNAKAQQAGYIRMIVQVWGKATQRGTISDIGDKVRETVRTLTQTDHYGYNLNEYEQRVINDNTTGTPLMQSYNSLRVFYSRR